MSSWEPFEEGGELEPAKDLGVLGKLQQRGNDFVRCFQCGQLKNQSDLHLSEHLGPTSFAGVNLQSTWARLQPLRFSTCEPFPFWRTIIRLCIIQERDVLS